MGGPDMLLLLLLRAGPVILLVLLLLLLLLVAGSAIQLVQTGQTACICGEIGCQAADNTW